MAFLFGLLLVGRLFALLARVVFVGLIFLDLFCRLLGVLLV